MHLSRILDQTKRHPSPTEALTKLGKAMDKHEDNLLEKGFRILKSELCANVYEAINGPHFDEEHVGICPKVWCRLPREGVFVFEVRNTPATASANLPVFVSTTGSVSTASNNKNVPVVKGDSTPLLGSEVKAGNRYWVYYNKCDNIIQFMNHYTVAPAA